MSAFEIHLFGRMRGCFAGGGADLRLEPKTKLLLAYLLLAPDHFHTREAVYTVLWGERSDDRARACLNTTLWRLRRDLRLAADDGEQYIVASTAGDLGFNWDREHWVDLYAFEKSATSFLSMSVEHLSKSDVDGMQSDMCLYVGELLEGFYDDWALHERERLRLLYLDCAIHLMRYFRLQDALDDSLKFGHLVLQHDPLRESIHREVIWTHWRLGDRSQAVRQYQRCCVILDEELGVGPMPETRGLYERIVSGSESGLDGATFALPAHATHIRDAATIDDLSKQIRHTMQNIEQAHRDLSHVLNQLQSLQAGQSGDVHRQ